jgi:hypothetical protein
MNAKSKVAKTKASDEPDGPLMGIVGPSGGSFAQEIRFWLRKLKH